MSIVIPMISIITIIAITGGAAELQTNNNFLEVASEIEGCPYLENAEYEVTMKASISALTGGCAYVYYNSSGIKSQSFRLYFVNMYHGGQHCIDRGIEFFHFYCLSKSPSRAEDIISGRMYIGLFDADVNKEGGQDRRCALYHKIKDNDFFMTFVVMISSDDSCVGLSDTLYSPEWIPSHKEGSMLLIFNRTKSSSPITPATTTTTESIQLIYDRYESDRYIPTTAATTAATTTTESIQLIYDRYERLSYFVKNFGGRTNPIRATKRLVNHTNKKRELQMSDGEGRYGAVRDITSYDGLQSDIDDKDVSMTTIKHKNWLRQPLEINHTQIRNKRSRSNVTST